MAKLHFAILDKELYSIGKGVERMLFEVSLGNRSYDVIAHRGGIAELKSRMELNRKVLIVTDTGVPKQHVSAVLSQCPHGITAAVEQGEGSKSLETFQALCGRLLEAGFTRGDLVIAVGGGVVGDLAGFVAASYMRGIDFVNIPTTTLSQIDSGIGGKVAVNLNGVKNILGAFHQPKLVIADADTLETLPLRHRNNGLVEGLKAGLIGDTELFRIFEEEDLPSHLEEIILRSLQVKKAVVEADETETGVRKLLNFGHTIGHGLESVYGLSEEGALLHGEAVAAGMLPMIDESLLRERVAHILRDKLRIEPLPHYDAEQIHLVMTRDKKAHDGMISTVRVKAAGAAYLKEITFSELQKLL